ncbi:hypothetical protein DV713_00700 [Parageobacillus thermoglucosidasius]|nr:hypothetical protein DV713_00700 [Parageobacillus thermoglucosidasius]
MINSKVFPGILIEILFGFELLNGIETSLVVFEVGVVDTGKIKKVSINKIEINSFNFFIILPPYV